MTRRTLAGDVSGPVRDFCTAYLDASVFAGSLQSRLPVSIQLSVTLLKKQMTVTDPPGAGRREKYQGAEAAWVLAWAWAADLHAAIFCGPAS